MPKVKRKEVHQPSRARVSAALRIASAISISHDDTGRGRPLVPTEGPSTWQERPSLESWARCLFHKSLNEYFSDVYSTMLLDTLGCSARGTTMQADPVARAEAVGGKLRILGAEVKDVTAPRRRLHT